MPRNRPDLDFVLTPEYEKEIISLESEAESKVSRTMSAIESAVDSWNAAGKKPPTLRQKIARLQRFYDELVKWERKSLQAKNNNDIKARIKRLADFVEICSGYEKKDKVAD